MITSQEKKRGQLSKEEREVIANNLDLKSDEEIAAIINREPYVVAKFRAQQPVKHENESLKDIIQQLHMKFFWKETAQQLMNDEIPYFEQFWASLIQQFASSGITTTDEQMIRDLVMLDIHVNRSNVAKRNAYVELDATEQQIEQLNIQYADDAITRVTKVEPLQSRANALRGAMKALSEEYKILADKKDKKYEQLKATRLQRLEKIEKAGRSFYDLVKMLDSPETREKEGRLNELYKLATEMSKRQFEQYHTYEDGKLDRPFLTAEAEEQGNEEKV